MRSFHHSISLRFSRCSTVFPAHRSLGLSAEICPPARILYCLAREAFSVSITVSCTVFRSPSSTLIRTPLLSYGLSCSASYQSKSTSESQLKIRYSAGTIPRSRNLPFWSVTSARHFHALSLCGATGIALTGFHLDFQYRDPWTAGQVCGGH